MMKTIRTIGSIKTLAELKLVQKNLRQQLRYNEDVIKLQTGEIVSGFKVIITGIMVQRSLSYLIGCFIRKKN